jgi:hypothetical protein
MLVEAVENFLDQPGPRHEMINSFERSFQALIGIEKSQLTIVASANQNLTHQIRTGRDKQPFFEVPIRRKGPTKYSEPANIRDPPSAPSFHNFGPCSTLPSLMELCNHLDGDMATGLLQTTNGCGIIGRCLPKLAGHIPDAPP